MKSFALLALVALVARAAYASPMIAPPPPPPEPSPYPGQGTGFPNEFKYLGYDEKSSTDTASRTSVHNGFGDYAAVMKEAMSSLGNSEDTTFKLYFPSTATRENKPDTDGRKYVQGVFSRMYSTSFNMAAVFIRNLVVYNEDFRNSCEPSDTAYSTLEKIHICPAGLKQTIKASDNTCTSLGNTISEKMNSLTGTLIHEFMHQKDVGDKATNTVGHIEDVVYGAKNCVEQNQGDNPQKAFVNADSYKWFALTAYYNSKCNKKFNSPVANAQELASLQDELDDSPEHNLSSRT